MALVTLAPCIAAAGPLEQLGAKMASSQLEKITDRTLAEYFDGLVNMSETNQGTCGATIRTTSGTLPVAGAIVALRRVADCASPKPVLAIRLTITEAGADAVRGAMRPGLGAPCLDGPGAMAAPSLVWSDQHRMLGVVQDPPPGKAFSVFFVNQDTTGSSDPEAEQALRRMLESELPKSCHITG